jgi:hypothetical protein
VVLIAKSRTIPFGIIIVAIESDVRKLDAQGLYPFTGLVTLSAKARDIAPAFRYSIGYTKALC